LLKRRLLALSILSFMTHPAIAAEIPTVGCAVDGETGVIAAPAKGTRNLEIDQASADGLAYYESRDSVPVLAPRGWKCLAYYSDAGATLVVARDAAPQPGTKQIDGPAVVLHLYNAKTSGAFGVADYLARLFPDEGKAFIHDQIVVARGGELSTYKFGPYPTDKLDFTAPLRVSFETPAERDGIGTVELLSPSPLPVSGLVDYRKPVGLMFVLEMRLPADLDGLKPAIAQEVEARIDKSLAK
jgi:hypothetical protein